MKPPVIILGMHRSGTSLFSQWLSSSGLHLGDRLYGASSFNPYGYFEDCDFIELHKALLKSIGGCDSGHEKPLGSRSLFNSDLEKVSALLKHKGGDFMWGWKEPRTCLLLPVYREQCPEARYVVVVRRYESIIASLVKRERVNQCRFISFFRRLGAEDLVIKYYQWRFNNYYAEIVDYYFSCLLSHCEKVEENAIVVNLDNLLVSPHAVKRCLMVFLPELDFVDFEDVYDGSVMSSPTDIHFISGKVRAALDDKYQALIRLSVSHG
ncbi:sulfotransferase [Alcanivorax sp.]|uniref:sulfotransferase n=1 Tax=Alcanivorax sp. TaxID=1872427 RepID=UPI0025BCE5CD|nr:sulfotransferase [Alcanivorax sp.]